LKLSFRDKLIIFKACRLAKFKLFTTIKIDKLVKNDRQYDRIAKLIQSHYFYLPPGKEYKKDSIEISELAINAAELFEDSIFGKIIWSVIVPIVVAFTTTMITLWLKK